MHSKTNKPFYETLHDNRVIAESDVAIGVLHSPVAFGIAST